MELFAFAGVSNSDILLTAAAVLGVAAIVSVLLRSLGLSANSALANRIERLEVRTASTGNYGAVISMASDILASVDAHGTPHVVAMFEDSSSDNRWFAPGVSAVDAAASLLEELKSGIGIAAAVARPIQSMIDNGSIEVRAERTRLAGDLRKHVAGIRTSVWDRHGKSILAAGVPSTTVSSIVDCVTRLNTLKASTLALTRSSPVDAYAGVLTQAADILTAAARSADLFEGRLADGEAHDLNAGTDTDVAPAEVAGHEATHGDAEVSSHDEHHHQADDHNHAHAA